MPMRPIGRIFVERFQQTPSRSIQSGLGTTMRWKLRVFGWRLPADKVTLAGPMSVATRAATGASFALVLSPESGCRGMSFRS